WRELTEAPEDRLGFTAGSEDGLQGRASAAARGEPWPRAESPEGRGARVAAAGLALDDLVVEVRSHVVEQQVGVQRHLEVADREARGGAGGRGRRGGREG